MWVLNAQRRERERERERDLLPPSFPHDNKPPPQKTHRTSRARDGVMAIPPNASRAAATRRTSSSSSPTLCAAVASSGVAGASVV